MDYKLTLEFSGNTVSMTEGLGILTEYLEVVLIIMYLFTIQVTIYFLKSPLLLKEGWPSASRRMAGVVDYDSSLKYIKRLEQTPTRSQEDLS